MNKKGISHVIVIVLLIVVAIAVLIPLAVIAAVGLNFWIGGPTAGPSADLTGQPTTKHKPRTITAKTVKCDANGNTKLLISNTADPSTTPINANNLQTSMSEVELDCGKDAIIKPGDTAKCTAKNFYKDNGTMSIFGSNTAATEVSC